MKILVGYRGSNVGKDLLDLAVRHAQAFDAERVMLVTSLFGGEKTSKAQIEEAEDRLAYAKKVLADCGVAAESHLLVRGRTAGEDLVDFAREQECAEILIGVKSRSKIGKMLFGSTAQTVILKAECPVVVIK